jgi:hypothetical protein
VQRRIRRKPLATLASAALAATLSLAGQEARAAPPAPAAHEARDCPPVDGLRFLCGLANAEDLVLLPRTRFIVAGGLGPRDGAGPPGALRIVDTRSHAWRQAYPTWRQWYPDDPANHHLHTAEFPGCKGPPAPATMAVHGLAVRRSPQGRLMVYAVDHGPAERIEAFEVHLGGGWPELVWIGCIAPPAPLQVNSLAVTPDGTVFATVFRLPGETLEDVRAGKATGGVYEWSPGGTGFRRLPLALSGPNGIEISPDGRTLYFAEFGRKQVVGFSRSELAGPVGAARFEGFWPDNVHWDDRGRLITAGMNHNYDDCVDAPWPAVSPRPGCTRAYTVMAIDPHTFAVHPIAQGATHPAFSNVSSGLVIDGALWLGAYRADRIAYRRLTPGPAAR